MPPIPYEIADAFRVMGVLWAREQMNADDDGAMQVERIVGLLRTYCAHEQEDGDSSVEPYGVCC